MTDKALFQQLLAKTREAYALSDISKHAWHYAVSGTPFLKGKGLILGISWGGANLREKYEAQTEMPHDEAIDHYPFIRLMLPFLKKYLKVNNIREVNYTNISFFRSPRVDELSEHDWSLILPIFKEYLCHIKPAWIVYTSANAERIKQCIDIREEIHFTASKRNRVFNAFRAKGVIDDVAIPIYSFPHPNARVPDVVRAKLWMDVFH